MDTEFERAEEVRHRVIGCAIEVHRQLGPGLLEAAYADCLVIECRHQALNVETDQHVPLIYRGQRIRSDFKMDILVEDLVVVELKAVAAIAPVHVAQLITYLKLTDRPAGVLLNFNVELMKNGIRRIDHPKFYVARPRKDERAQPPNTSSPELT
jgi:GxxExxY protein